MWRPTIVLLVLMITGPARGQPVYPFACRLGESQAIPEVGEETVLGGFAEAGEHLAVYCHGTRNGIESETRSRNSQPETGERFLVAFGTPVMVRRVEKVAGVTLVGVQIEGGPYQGQSVYVWPHDTLRRMTKEEMNAERRAPRLPGTYGHPKKKLEVGKTVMLGILDLKSPYSDPHLSNLGEYPDLLRQIPAFAGMAEFRNYYRVMKEHEKPARRTREPLGLPVTTRVKVEEVVAESGEIPSATVVTIALGPAQGERYIVPASAIIDYGRTFLQVPERVDRRAMPDYSPSTDRRPARKAKSKAADTP